MSPECSYCTGDACGLDEDGLYTCGSPTRMPVINPLPVYIEQSETDEDEVD